MWYSIIYYAKPRIIESWIFMKKKAIKEKFNNLFNSMEKLENSVASHDVTRETMKRQCFDWYLDEYLRLFGEIQKAINECSDEKIRTSAEKEFKCLSDDMRKLLVQNLHRIIFPIDNFHNKATSLAELENVVKKVEDDFDKEVQKAVEYFGDSFFEAKLRVPRSVAYQDYPRTVKEMLQSKKRYDWSEHQISCGFPKPLYRELYLDSLTLIIEKYIKGYESKIEK